MTPPEVYGLDLDTLCRRVYVTERRTEGDHVELGVDLQDQTALEPCVDSLDGWFLAEELAIGICRGLEDR